jgi:ADP-heptose:LPS heptosyltransferase
MTGDYEKGLADYGQRFRFSPSSEPKRRSPRWTGGAATGKRLLVMGEQGLGDMVMVSRFMPKLRETWDEIWLTSRGPTKRLFDGAPYVDRVFDKNDPPPEGEEDAHVPAMDLMAIYGLTPENCPPPPPLAIPDEARERARRITAPYKNFFRIGICWAGSPTFVQARRKATELWRFLDLATIPGVQLFGMCKGEREADITELGADGLILNAAATDRDFADAAAVAERMDLIITVDTGLGHVAGTLGVPTWVLLAKPPFWYWGPYGEDTYWYESMRLIRQHTPGEWDAPFATIRADLENMVL